MSNLTNLLSALTVIYPNAEIKADVWPDGSGEIYVDGGMRIMWENAYNVGNRTRAAAHFLLLDKRKIFDGLWLP